MNRKEAMALKKGDRVKLTAEALRMFPQTRFRRGVVDRLARDGQRIYFLSNGARRSNGWHYEFLEIDDAAPRSRRPAE